MKLDQEVGLVYQELRRLAGSFVQREQQGLSLSATDLVHEVYCRLKTGVDPQWENREHFLSIAARAMRNLLIDHARRRNREKRGGDWQRVSFREDMTDVSAGLDLNQLLSLDDALTRLSELDPRQAQMVEMRYFGGMTHTEIGLALGITRRTVDRDWLHARSWLRRELTDFSIGS